MTLDISLETSDNNDENQELYDFIENSINGTIFHHPKFLSYHDKNKFPEPDYSITHLVFREKNKIIAFLPGIIHRNENKAHFHSPYGASFGGLITNDISFEKYDCIVDMIFNYLTSEKSVAEINITPPTSIYMGDEVNDYLEYIYLRKGFTVRKCELTIVTRVSKDSDFPRSILKNRVRSSVSKSERERIVCQISENHDIAYPIIKENQKKFNKKPTHTLTELKTIAYLFPGRTLQFIAYKENIPISAVTLILCNRHVAFTFYIAHLEEYAIYRPVDFLLNKILIWLKKMGYTYLDFGPSTFGFEPHNSLIFFKEGFGGKGIIKYFYRYKVD